VEISGGQKVFSAQATDFLNGPVVSRFTTRSGRSQSLVCRVFRHGTWPDMDTPQLQATPSAGDGRAARVHPLAAVAPMNFHGGKRFADRPRRAWLLPNRLPPVPSRNGHAGCWRTAPICVTSSRCSVTPG
jgi:hypothetical protein